MLQLVAPDGVAIDALYFRGVGAALDGPTVVRFNGNAEAIELQDEMLPRIYTMNGLNFIMFNYRGGGYTECICLYVYMCVCMIESALYILILITVV